MTATARPTGSLLKALHVIEPAPVGGAEAVVAGLVAETVRRGGQVAVAGINQGASPSRFMQAIQELGAETHEVRCGRRRYLAEARRLAEIIGQSSPAIVHTHVYHADVIGWWAGRRVQTPIAATVHGFTDGNWKQRCYQWLDMLALRRMSAVLCVSEGLRDRVVRGGCDARRVHVVPNAFSARPGLTRAQARAALGLKDATHVIGWVGRLSKEKGPDLLIESLRRVPLASGAIAVLLGDGPERAALERSVGTTGAIRLLGARPDAAKLLRAFDVLVISSRTEGLPMVLLEAMAAEVPVVSFAVGGIPHTVDDESAWLVPPGDVAGLGEAITAAVAAPHEAARRVARAGAILRTRFAAGEWLERVQEVYAQALREYDAGRR